MERGDPSPSEVVAANLDLLLERAAAAIEAGEPASAVDLAASALALDPTSKDAETVLAFARFRARGAAPTDVSARRRLTVLFCDVVGSTALAAELDPEDIREVLLGYQRRAVGAIESLGGHLARFIGDGILAYFGYPRAHEDDAVRAVLAGRAIVEAMDSWRAEHPAAARVRVGIHTGLVVVAEMGVGARAISDDIVGETPNIAARLQAIAEPGEILISDVTRSLVGATVDVEGLGPVELKGVRPLDAYRVVGEREVDSLFEARARPVTELVGRTDELAALLAALDRGSERTAVVVEGEAGIGKSRLVRELVRIARERGGRGIVLQCNQLLANEPLAPLVRFLRSTFDLDALRREPAGLARATGLDQPADLAALASLLSLPIDPVAETVEMAAAQRRELLFRSLLHLVDRLAAERSLLLVVEDAHWADPTTVELLQRVAADDGNPLLLVLTTRPGGADLPGAELVPLMPLPTKACLELLRHVAGGEPLADDAVAAIVERSDGVPLYVEELTRVLTDPASRWLGDDASGVPATLNDLLVARLDQFASQRTVVAALATVGQPASAALLSAVLDEPEGDVTLALDQLVAGALVRVRGGQYDFRHVLVRDTAYHLQLRRRRRVLHRRIADVLADEMAAAGEDQPDVLALHYERAGEPALAAAARFRAGLRQADLAAHEEAIQSFRQASRLAELAGVEVQPGFEVDVEHALATSLLAVRGYTAPEVAEAFERVRELTAGGGERHQLAASYGLWAFYHVRGDNRTSSELAEQLVRLASAYGEPELLAAKAVLGYQRCWVGELEPGRALLAEASARPADLGADPLPHDPGTGAAANLALPLALLGRVDDAKATAAAAVARAAALTTPTAAFTFSYATAWAALASNLMEAYDDAERYAGACLQRSGEYGFSTWLAVSWFQMLTTQALSTPTEEVVDQLVGGLQAYEAAGARSNRSQWLHALAMAQQRLGRVDEAVVTLDDALAHVEEADERFLEAELHRAHAMAVAGRDGATEAVLAELRGAIDLGRRQGAKLLELRGLADLCRVGEGPEVEAAGQRLDTLLGELAIDDQPSVSAARLLREAS